MVFMFPSIFVQHSLPLGSSGHRPILTNTSSALFTAQTAWIHQNTQAGSNHPSNEYHFQDSPEDQQRCSSSCLARGTSQSPDPPGRDLWPLCREPRGDHQSRVISDDQSGDISDDQSGVISDDQSVLLVITLTVISWVTAHTPPVRSIETELNIINIPSFSLFNLGSFFTNV